MKLKLALMVSLCFIVCGCTTQKTDSPKLVDIEFTVQILRDEKEYSCFGSFIDDELKLIMESPDTIKDTTIVFKDQMVCVEYLGLETKTPISDFPQNDTSLILYKIINSLGDGEGKRNDDKNYIISGKIEERDFEFMLSPSFLPISICVPELNLNLQFSDVTLK